LLERVDSCLGQHGDALACGDQAAGRLEGLDLDAQAQECDLWNRLLDTHAAEDHGRRRMT
jgi:hypothetical protein